MKKILCAFVASCVLLLAACGQAPSPAASSAGAASEAPGEVQQLTGGGSGGPTVAFADATWATYDGYGVTIEYPATWSLYCYPEVSAAQYAVLMVSEGEDIFIRCYVTEQDPAPVTILSPSENGEAKLFYEAVREKAVRAADFPLLDMAAAMEGDEAVIEFMMALEEYNANPKAPLPEYTGELPRGQASTLEAVQLADDGCLAAVQDGDTGLYGYIDKTGAWRIEPRFQRAYRFSDGRAMVQLEDGRWAYIDSAGTPVITEVRAGDGGTYPLASSVAFREGIAAVNLQAENDYDMLYIDRDGNVLFSAAHLPKVSGVGYGSSYLFGFASNFTGGKAVAARRVNRDIDQWSDSEDAPVIVDTSGNILATIPKEYYVDENGFDPNMRVKVKPGGPFHGEDLYGLCDETGALVVPCQYPYLEYCENGWYLAQAQSGSYGFIDKDGNVKVEFGFENAGKFSSGLAPVLLDGLWGFIDETGELAIEPAYSFASAVTTNADPHVGSCTFWDGVGKVQDGDRWVLIDTEGNVVVDDAGISGFFACGNGLLAYQDAQSGLLGYMTTDGKIAIEARFPDADTFFPAS